MRPIVEHRSLVRVALGAPGAWTVGEGAATGPFR